MIPARPTERNLQMPDARPRRAAAGVRIASVLVVAGALLAPATPASAHITVEPATSASGELVQLTFTVPNEQPGQDTVGLDLKLPQGFLLESAQSVPGWTTVIDTAADQTPTAVHWSGGRSGPGTFVSFAIRGRMPTGGSTAAFPAVQRYTRTSVSWSGPDQASTRPAPLVSLQAAVKGLDGGTPPTVPAATVPAAAAGAAGAAGVGGGPDALARSRSSLALALALGSLLLALGALAATLLLRREPPTPTSPTPSPTPTPTAKPPATPKPTGKPTRTRKRPPGAP